MAILLTGCIVYANGDGIIRTKNYRFRNFRELVISGDFEVNIEMGQADRVSVTTDGNLFNYIDIEYKQGVLFIQPNQRTVITTNHGIIVNIAASSINFIKNSGKSEIAIKEMNAEKFEYHSSGKNKLLIGGNLKNFRANVQSGATVDARFLQTINAHVTATNRSKVLIKPTEYLFARVARRSVIEYFGKPKDVVKHATPDSQVRQNLDPTMKPFEPKKKDQESN